jgi:hypothetical protein
MCTCAVHVGLDTRNMCHVDLVSPSRWESAFLNIMVMCTYVVVPIGMCIDILLKIKHMCTKAKTCTYLQCIVAAHSFKHFPIFLVQRQQFLGLCAAKNEQACEYIHRYTCARTHIQSRKNHAPNAPCAHKFFRRNTGLFHACKQICIHRHARCLMKVC